MVDTQLRKAENMLNGYLNNMVWLNSDQCTLDATQKEVTKNTIQSNIDKWTKNVNILKG